jgi:hypothetical protein
MGMEVTMQSFLQIQGWEKSQNNRMAHGAQQLSNFHEWTTVSGLIPLIQ